MSFICIRVVVMMHFFAFIVASQTVREPVNDTLNLPRLFLAGTWAQCVVYFV